MPWLPGIAITPLANMLASGRTLAGALRNRTIGIGPV